MQFLNVGTADDNGNPGICKTANWPISTKRYLLTRDCLCDLFV